jgi:hypothetical protein
LDESIKYVLHSRPKGVKVGMGLSLGAGVLTKVIHYIPNIFSKYLALKKNDSGLLASVGIGCHYDLSEAMKHMSNHIWGIYDIILGYYTRLLSHKPIRIID